MPGKTGSRIVLRAGVGQPFGLAKVIDPEVRIHQTDKRPYGVRAARLRCVCGTEYVAQLSHLYAKNARGHACADCSVKAAAKRKRQLGGTVVARTRGFQVQVYVGHYKTRREAEDVAARARVVLLPRREDRPA